VSVRAIACSESVSGRPSLRSACTTCKAVLRTADADWPRPRRMIRWD